MNLVFEQLWNGNMVPCKNCGRNDPEVVQLAELIEENRASLDSVLSDKQKKQLKSYMACYDEYWYLITVHAFREGFSLASRLLAAALRENQ